MLGRAVTAVLPCRARAVRAFHVTVNVLAPKYNTEKDMPRVREAREVPDPKASRQIAEVRQRVEGLLAVRPQHTVCRRCTAVQPPALAIYSHPRMFWSG